jgi:alpha,alpha-trehalase
MTYKGLKNYQIDKLANEIRKRWLRQNERVFKATGKMMEKYNVMDTMLIAGGGEYPNQDGFGWTNGVALALKKETTYKLQKK